MKYIRTKDGVMLTEDYLKKSEIFQAIKYLNVTPEKFLQGIPQSENLEELCDEFVITCVEDYEYKHFYPKIADINDASEYATEDVYIVYGAIYTDKGLIYVAKMNDRGELELI